LSGPTAPARQVYLTPRNLRDASSLISETDNAANNHHIDIDRAPSPESDGRTADRGPSAAVSAASGAASIPSMRGKTIRGA